MDWPVPPASKGQPRKASKRTPARPVRVAADLVPVVAIGASAGGLEPLEQFFASLNADSGYAYVVVQHLSPDFRSMMGEILGRQCPMEIEHARDGLPLRPNVIYLNLPRCNVTLSGNSLQVADVGDTLGTVSTIDALFTSLARERGDKAVAIVLSGSGSDGSRGAEAVHRANGVVIVQDPETAKFDGMPCAAIARGSASFIMAPDRMRLVLSRLTAGSTKAEIGDASKTSSDPKTIILAMLRDRFGSDFGLYKNATIGRRIDRRITMRGYADIASYAAALQSDEEELDALYHDILIGVTSFFRDREAFDFLQDHIIPQIVEKQRNGEFIRVWVAACATGEEAYSLAIAFEDYAERSGERLNLKIIATDIHKRSLEVAARGSFPKSQVKSLDKAILSKYFIQNGDEYTVAPKIRKYIVFSCHDLTSNPPFTRIDLVTCRNLLIYLNQPTQQKVLSFLHFALRKDGYMMLGPSEALGRVSDEFATLSDTWRIYQKLRDVRLIDHALPSMFGKRTDLLGFDANAGTGAAPEMAGRKQLRPRDITDAYDALLKRYAPAGFLITYAGQIVRIFGDASRYIDVTGGSFSQNLLDLLVGSLRISAAAGLEHLRRSPSKPYHRVVTVRDATGSLPNAVDLAMEPLAGISGPAQFVMVTVGDLAAPASRSLSQPAVLETTEASAGDILHNRIVELEREVATREVSVQSLVEEFETSNEELQATNEELMASNEELQSTNEELHSVNEELYTVSGEHQRKIEQLLQLTSDIEHLLRSTNIGTMFVDVESRIRSFTPMATRAFNLIDQDIGRPLSNITARFELPQWAAAVRQVIDGGPSFEREVCCDDRYYLLRVLPYKVRSDCIDGAVITLVDIDALHETSKKLEESEARYRALYRRTPAKLYSISSNGLIVEVSEYWLEQMGFSREEIIGKPMIDLLSPATREQVETSVMPRLWAEGAIRQVPCEFIKKSGAIMEVELSMIRDESMGSDRAVAVSVDVTERNHARRTLELRNKELERSNDALSQYANMASHDLQEPLRKIKSYCTILAQELGDTVSEDARYAMYVLADASDRLSLLVASLLQFSRVSSGAMKMAVVDLAEPVRAAMSHLELEIQAAEAVIEIGALPKILADRILIERVFQNLLGNAIKYRHRDRRPLIRIELRTTNGTPAITITDNGIGFDSRYASVIFEPLKRLHGTSEYPGAGIGLAVTKAIVDRHGWSITAEGREGEGARFTIALPKFLQEGRE